MMMIMIIRFQYHFILRLMFNQLSTHYHHLPNFHHSPFTALHTNHLTIFFIHIKTPLSFFFFQTSAMFCSRIFKWNKFPRWFIFPISHLISFAIQLFDCWSSWQLSILTFFLVFIFLIIIIISHLIASLSIIYTIFSSFFITFLFFP